ncbi:MAG: hypothetical protein ABIZ91_05985 [Gemmatimonadaceae bacterium]
MQSQSQSGSNRRNGLVVESETGEIGRRLRALCFAEYDNNGVDARLQLERSITLSAPYRRKRRRRAQDGRPLRRYVRRWKVERLFV